MNEKLYEALEISLNALETGADPESVLKLFPELKEELLPLLEASRQARLLALPEVPQKVLRRSKARVLQHAAGMRAASAKARRQRVLFTFPRLAISLAIALLFLFSGTELVRASDGALPGDNLYPVKRTWEDVRLLLVFNPESREELESEFEQERLHEVDELLAEGRHETITFAGVVTEQNASLWVVSGVPVQITPESRLPGTPVTVGTSIMLGGRTNAQGFVEAEYIEVLGPDIVLPTGVPTEMESSEDNSGHGNSGAETNENSGQGNENDDHIEDKSGSSNEDQAEDGTEDNSDDSDDNSNSSSGTNETNNNEDHSEEDRSGKGGGEDQNDSSGSGSGDESHD